MLNGFWMNPRQPRQADIHGLAAEAVAAGKQDARAGVDLLQAGENPGAAHPGHDHVQYDQVDAFMVLPENLQGLAAAAGRQDGIAQGDQHLPGHVEDHLLVIDEQDGFAAARRLQRGFLDLGDRLVGGGQVDMEGAAAAFLALHGDACRHGS